MLHADPVQLLGGFSTNQNSQNATACVATYGSSALHQFLNQVLRSKLRADLANTLLRESQGFGCATARRLVVFALEKP